ncbi:glycosyltransferase family 4 protein [Candidatus Uhrbacteria bacterium]|nr:glycosyltransferase family 4 protein [Candidatus Uhrbacteria bacterium]
MRVVHLACVAPPEIGGIGTAALREVVGLRARGIDARLIAPETGREADEDDRSFVTRVHPIVRWGNGAILPPLQKQLKGADVIHLHYPFLGVAERLLSGIQREIPIVMTFHMDPTPKGIKGVLVRAHRMMIQPFLLPHASKIIVSSLDYAQRSSARHFFATHLDRVVELPFGIDTEFFSPGPSHRERFLIPADAPTLLFVGGLDRAHSFKGVEELFRAFAMLDPSTHLIMIGDGDVRTVYESIARESGFESRVHFLGRVDDETVRDAYRSADVFVFPSTSEAEAFGLVAVEAEACGLPVVASSLPGVRTVVRHQETGFLVPPKDVEALAAAIKQLLSDAPMRRTFGERGRALAQERFSWDRHLDGLMEVYREVCALRS